MAHGDIDYKPTCIGGGKQIGYTIENINGVDRAVGAVGIRLHDDEMVATIPNGQSRSQIINAGLYAGMILHVLGSFPADRHLGVAVRNPVDGSFDILRDDAAAVIDADTTTRPGAYSFPAEFFASCRFQLVLLTDAGAEVAAGAELQIGVTLKA